MQDLKKLHLKINRLVDSLFVGNYKTAFKWRGLEFSDYRVYDDNDDAKYIDFLASAREWKLLIKRFEEERELSVFFLLDISESMNFWQTEKKKIDTLIETFSILAFSANKNNDKIGAIIFNEYGFELIKLWKWMKNIHKILEIIKQNHSSTKNQKNKIKSIQNFWVNTMLSYFHNLPIKNSLVFLLTDKMNEFEEKNLKIASLKNDFVYINIFDHFENNLLHTLWVARLRDNIQTFFIYLWNKKKIEAYRSMRHKKIQDFSKKLHKFKISYFFLDNTSNIFAKLLVFFKSR